MIEQKKINKIFRAGINGVNSNNYYSMRNELEVLLERRHISRDESITLEQLYIALTDSIDEQDKAIEDKYLDI